MQPSAVLVCHGFLLFALSILKLTLASQLPSEGPLGAGSTESLDIEPLLTTTRRPLPSELWRLILEKCNLTEYVHFLLAYPEMQSVRLSEVVEFNLLEKAFQELDHIDSCTVKTFDYERHKSIVTVIREFINLLLIQPLGEGGAVSGADKEARRTVVRLAEKFSGDSQYSQLARRILFSTMMKYLHGADIDMETFEKYRDDILYAAALGGNYDQLRALVDKSKLGWNRAASIVMSAIAQSGSVELFEQVLQVASRQAVMGGFFGQDVIKFNNQRLFREFVLQLKSDSFRNQPRALWRVFNACCQYERQELIQVLIEHRSEDLLTLSLKDGILIVIRNGNMDLFTMLLGDPALSDLWESLSPDYYTLLYNANYYNRVDMIKFMLSLGGIDESVILNVFASAVTNGNTKVMELLLGAGPDGCMWISTLPVVNDQIIDRIGRSGLVDVIEFFLRKQEEGDARFDGFKVGMIENAIFCSACSQGKYDLVEYLLRRDTTTGEFIFPDMNPAARNNEPLGNAIRHMEIVRELLRQDQEGAMYYRNVAVTDKVLLLAAESPCLDIFEFLLQTVKHDDGSIQFKFPITDINFSDHAMLEYLVSGQVVNKLNVLFRRDSDSGDFVLPGIQVPERFADQLDTLEVLWRP